MVWLKVAGHRIRGRVGRGLCGVVIWCGNDSGHSLIANVAFNLVVDVGVTARGRRVSRAGSCGLSYGEGFCISESDCDRKGDEGGVY